MRKVSAYFINENHENKGGAFVTLDSVNRILKRNIVNIKLLQLVQTFQMKIWYLSVFQKKVRV